MNELNRVPNLHVPNWAAFYRRLCHVGPIALKGVARDLVPALQAYARTGEGFWSDDYQEILFEGWADPVAAVELVMDAFADEVRREFMDDPLCWFGPVQAVQTTRTWSEHQRAVEAIGYRLTPPLRRSLIQAALSPFPPKGKQTVNRTVSGSCSGLGKAEKPSLSETLPLV